jgi:hypothetical protein
MAENKTQFQKGLSLSVFLRRFGAEEQTPVTPVCPWQAKRNSTAGSGHLPVRARNHKSPGPQTRPSVGPH